MALQLGATFVARSFSGDKEQLVPLIEAALKHQGAAFIDCISPCVAFNNHEGSHTSFDYVREHNLAVNYLDVITEPRADHRRIRRRHGRDGEAARRLGAAPAQARQRLRRARPDRAMTYLQERQAAGEIVTGLLYVDPEPEDLHHHMNTVITPFNELDEAALCPGSAALAKLNASLR